MSEGTVEDVPPSSYNVQAPTAPSAYNPSAPAGKPIASQPAVKYVDQNGNPVNPPTTANVKYVDQNGNPVNPPPSANVKYVDQNGNPVAAPKTANVKYVDQYGNPVNPPPTANVKYVDQYGNPVNPPPTANVKYVDQYGNPVAAPKTAQQPTANCRSIKQQKTASFFLGGIALLILFIGLFVDSLASDTRCSCGGHCCNITYTCGWTEFTVDCDESLGGCCSSPCIDSSFSYGDYCDVSPSWCGTQASASISLVTMLISTIMCGIGVIFVQPWCKLTPCCCKTNSNCGCARVSFIFSLCFGILTLIIWFAGDDVCLGSSHSSVETDNMTIGGSMICDIIAMIFVIIAAVWGVN